MKYHFILTLVSLKTTFIISLQTAKMGCEAPTETKSTIDPGNNGMTNTIISASASEIEKGVILQKGRLLIPTKLIWDYLFSTAPDIVEKAATDPNPLLDIIA